MVTCPACQTQNPDAARFCMGCGMVDIFGVQVLHLSGTASDEPVARRWSGGGAARLHAIGGTG